MDLKFHHGHGLYPKYKAKPQGSGRWRHFWLLTKSAVKPKNHTKNQGHYDGFSGAGGRVVVEW
uniref:Uncharacterized protein n=1 Tax=Arundo donax TaxID=35708 RepID=A0A0A9DQL9_ARUDO